jgi:geranylgeranyl pyrophosphate synthase
MAFQIIDDVFDITGTESGIGKPVGVDLNNGKITLPTIQALKELEGTGKSRLLEIIRDPDGSDESYAKAVELIRSTSAVEYSKAMARNYVDSAMRALENRKDNEFYSSFVELAEYTVERIY